MMKNIFSNKSGMSLIDVIIATTIVAMGAVTAVVVVRVGLNGITLNQDRLFAISLATEGVESVRSVRDTNQLRYGANEDCWNSFAGTSVSDCDITTISDGTSYAPKVDLDDNFIYLEESFDDVFADVNRLYECSGLYVNPDSTVGCIETDFYRVVYIELDDPASPNYMTVISTVGWISGGEQKTATLTDKIYKP